MWIRIRRPASIAALALASATPLFADGGQWSSRYWGLGWGDGYHAPPRTGGLHSHGSLKQASLGNELHDAGPHRLGGQPGRLMPGGYPDRGQYDESQAGSSIPQWLWDPADETVIVDESGPSAQVAPDMDPVPPPPPSATSSQKAPRDPSLGLPPALTPTEPVDPRAMSRRGRTQARSNGWSR